MATIRPFYCIKPNKDMVRKIAALPYDIYNRKEAKEEVEKNSLSFLSIDRAETAFSDEIEFDSPIVYEHAKNLLNNWMEQGILEKDEEKSYYIYELTMKEKVQTGIVACVSIDDYLNRIIKKHENTRTKKEQDRINHINICNAQTGPIYLIYRANEIIRSIIELVKKDSPIYDFVTEDKVRHRVFKIVNEKQINDLEKAFDTICDIYIADGHHRAAAAVNVGMMRRKQCGQCDGTEEFNYFLSVLFPHDELSIMDYNRVVKDLNGMTKQEFLKKMSEHFEIQQISRRDIPMHKGQFKMFLDNKWYLCKMSEKKFDNVIYNLDVMKLQEEVLKPILGITDMKTDERIDFVGGIRGLEELESRCKKDCVVAFAMYPTSLEELFEISDRGMLMPPKSTWFEPKLRSGLFIHQI